MEGPDARVEAPGWGMALMPGLVPTGMGELCWSNVCVVGLWLVIVVLGVVWVPAFGVSLIAADSHRAVLGT